MFGTLGTLSRLFLLASYQARKTAAFFAAYIWRRLLFRTVVIGITGSTGKTTCKEILAEILTNHCANETGRRAFSRVYASYRNQNAALGLYRNLLRLRPWHRFAIIEVGIDRPNQMRFRAAAVRPDIAVVLGVEQTHRAALRTLEQVAKEKAQILDCLKPGGVAILNADDAYTRSMPTHRAGKLVLVGSTAGSDYEILEIRGRFPEPLSVTISANSTGEKARFRADLVGAHWAKSVAISAAIAHVVGVPFGHMPEYVTAIRPTPARLQPVSLPNGAVILRDEYNGSFATLGVAMEALANATAERRWMIISDFSDSPKGPRERLRWVAQHGASFLDGAIFIGDRAEAGAAFAVRAGIPAENVYAFPNTRAAARELSSILHFGDIALLRGRTTDHLSRLVYAQFGRVGCWVSTCERTILCDNCPELLPVGGNGEPFTLISPSRWVMGPFPEKDA